MNGHSQSGPRLWPWVLAAGAALAIGVAVAISFMILFARGNNEFTPRIEEILQLAENQDYSRAYDSVGEQWRAADTEEEFRDFFIVVDESLGELESLRVSGVRVQKQLGAPDRASAVFSGTFQKETTTLQATFGKYPDGWKVEGIHFDGLEDVKGGDSMEDRPE